jgi:hypothetical protein
MSTLPSAEGLVARPPAPQNRWLGRIALLVIATLLSGELGSRMFWAHKVKSPLLSRFSMWYTQYPLMRETKVLDAARTRTGNNFDILICGGSTICEGMGKIGLDLGRGLEARLGRPTRVFNLAYPAHNSRDSLIKYRFLSGQHFDLVVVYDGINDTRMNNSPAELFRDDYAHCHWYEMSNRLDAHPTLFQAALPYTVLFGVDRFLESTGLKWYVPTQRPKRGWDENGRQIRTPAILKRNLSEMIDIAHARKEPLVMMTFAYYIPGEEEAWPVKIGKDQFHAPIGMWGKAAYVAEALRQQNDEVRALAREHPEVIFIDQAHQMECSVKTFIDCCHFSVPGCELFTKNLLAGLSAIH